MIKMIKGTLAIVLGLTAWGAATTSAAASSQYSAARSKSFRLIWRRSMGHHEMTATKGARYSQHLGTRYGYNRATADYTWTTTAHEKLYNKKTRTYAIYYHVRNGDNTLQGWIWRGYLKAVPRVKPAKTKYATNAEEIAAQPVNLFRAKSTAEYEHAINTAAYYQLARAVWKLFPGTKLNLWLSQDAAYADQVQGLDNTDTDPTGMLSQNLRDYYHKNGVPNPEKVVYWGMDYHNQELADMVNAKVSFAKRLAYMKQIMDQDGMTAKKRQSFKGWYIGINMADTVKGFNPNTDPNWTYAGTYEIALAPANSFQTVNNQ